MKFLLKGIKNTQHIEIKIHAKSIKSANDLATNRGIIPIEITPMAPNDFFIKPFFIPKKELFLSFKQIALMLEAALPIDEILFHCIASSKHPSIRSMYQDILKNLHSGISLSQAFKKHVNIIGKMRFSLIEVGQNTGNLSKSFHLLAQEIQETQKDSSALRKKLFYPLIVLLSIIIAFGVLNTIVIPEFINLFEEFDLQLPLSTRTLIFIGDLLQRWGIFIGILLGVFMISIKTIIDKSKSLRQKAHQYLLKLPFIGKIFIYQDLHKCLFCLYLSEKTGIDIKTSLRNAHSSIYNNHTKNIFAHIIDIVENGENLSQAINKIKLFDEVAKGLILAGEQTGNLDNMLEMSSMHYKDLYHHQLDTFSQWIEPAMTLLIGLLVLWFALGILMPMWNLNNINL